MMKRSIKMIGLDLDGTLLNKEKKISDYTRNVLKQAIDQGVIILPATGRPVAGIPKEVMDFPGIRYVLTSNGARILDRLDGDKIIYERCLSVEDAKKLLCILREYDAMREIYYNGEGYTAKDDLENLDHFLKNPHMREYILTTRIRVNDVETGIDEHEMQFVDKINILFANQEERAIAWERLKKEFPELEVTTALVNNIEINGKDARKGTALVALGAHLGIKREEIMACGDGINDVEMLREVGFGVAMENASDEVKAAADYITVTNDEHGVAKAIEKFVLES